MVSRRSWKKCIYISGTGEIFVVRQALPTLFPNDSGFQLQENEKKKIFRNLQGDVYY